ncbi:helix-turn-helix transcriptional regulator [Burkholderia pseudomallei]|uniref:helix-turn-helix transcriptional regulator n=1 Tax=Burkholderia pseudomallei TaxID=28450 RepID=UPI00039E015B|nr:AlpA family phage regulatory protein [Burkholderia pseudomallei]MBF3451139.1 AlpA family phage regulatory protein [Burkholderia pseudomallei]MBF3475502.1 AlpA family phage regulatory protein [Burkholderia pseudomallei]MBF3511201.1 AlpA family phage regulatory protein [Burkholderia pseudomallei]MBF3513822.1 AlpA family phage regulatory protein [Burkholderia pseudomallei]MBF3584986.1 AlpA family phage regulatory protein [Burkholderia pseudomallei]
MAEQLRNALIRRKRVEELTSLSRTSIYQRMREKTFPPSIRLGSKSVAWRIQDIEKWLDDPAGYKVSTQEV